MKIEDFLEKQEKRDLQLFQYLVLSGGEAGYGEAAEHLEITKTSLDSNLEEIVFFIQPLEGKVSLEYDGKTIRLWMDPLYSLRELQHFFLDQSVKVRLIDYLFHHQEFSLVNLSIALSISESSLSRKIKELNQYLEEFGLRIWSGRLQGEEAHIRFFYFLFYSSVTPKSFSSKGKASNEQMLQATENYLNVSFDRENRERLLLWFEISRKRMNNKKKKTAQLKEKMIPYMEDTLYQKVRAMVWRFWSRYSIEPDEEEAQMLFAFLLASGVLPESFFHNYRLTRKRRAPIASADTYLVETIIIHYRFRKLPFMLERNMYHALSQLHAGLYFFIGNIDVHDTSFFLEQEKKRTEESFQSFACTLYAIGLEKMGMDEDTDNGLKNCTLLGYISVLMMVTLEMRRVLKIGIDLSLPFPFVEGVLPLLQIDLEQIPGVAAEPYEPGTAYDLIVTDRPAFDGGDMTVYVLSEYLSPFDQRNIEQLLQSMKSSKKR